ncbi:hypothetical protein ACRXCV_03800 [Halobacteriovorax sp. GFR7]|uniref:hypothetical protein n=1 Tax=unclassified Halobacteriovorax TaxID=2639665 RepID=UPI003D9851BA
MKFLILISVLLLSSCAGYRFSDSSNPFEAQGVHSVTVFVVKNHTGITGLSQIYTDQIVETLSSFSNLRVRTGKNYRSDAILLAEITSKKIAGKEVREQGDTLMSDDQKNQLGGNRNAFYLSTEGAYDFEVEVSVFKKPNFEEIKFYESFYKLDHSQFPRSIFSKKFSINSSYIIENTVGGIDSSAPLRSVKNRGTFKKSLADDAKDFGEDFREVLLYAF